MAAGAVSLRLLEELGVEACARVVNFGGVECDGGMRWDRLADLDASPLRTFDQGAEERIIDLIDSAKENGDTLGGVVEARFKGVPIGLGSVMQWDRKLDGKLAQAVMSIHSVKGFEVGDGWRAAGLPGSQVHDAMAGGAERYGRSSNRAGGLEGGMTNGEELVVRAAVKPIATLMKPLPTIDVITHEPADAARERSDVTAVPAASIVVLAMAALTLADAFIDKFGGDTLDELRERLSAHRAYAAEY